MPAALLVQLGTCFIVVLVKNSITIPPKGGIVIDIMVNFMKRNFRFLSYLLFFLSAVSAMAQKLPNKQQIGIRAPADINVDGKTAEWHDKFQAYNMNNRIFYTISNDDNNLYLTIRAGDGFSSEKALFGIGFNIQLPGDKRNKPEEVKIIFPKYNSVKKTDDLRLMVESARKREKDTIAAAKRSIDSLSLLANKAIGIEYKKVIVSGIETAYPITTTDNKEGIKVAAQFDASMRFTYEMALPLKYLGASINSGQKFKYYIKMLGQPEVSPNGMPSPQIVGNDMASFFNSDRGFVMLSTDLSGYYTLVKK